MACDVTACIRKRGRPGGSGEQENFLFFYWEHRNMSNIFRQLGIKMDIRERLEISFRGAFKKHFWV